MWPFPKRTLLAGPLSCYITYARTLLHLVNQVLQIEVNNSADRIDLGHTNNSRVFCDPLHGRFRNNHSSTWRWCLDTCWIRMLFHHSQTTLKVISGGSTRSLSSDLEKPCKSLFLNIMFTQRICQKRKPSSDCRYTHTNHCASEETDRHPKKHTSGPAVSMPPQQITSPSLQISIHWSLISK